MPSDLNDDDERRGQSLTASHDFPGRSLNRYWRLLLLVALLIHAGTAILRLSTFLPYPRLIDYSAFYVASNELHAGRLPYNVADETYEQHRLQNNLLFETPPIYNPPFFPWILQPFARLPFPVSATIWLAAMTLLLLTSCRYLSDLADMPVDSFSRWKLFAVLITFGPVFLDLTLGQTSTLLLFLMLVCGRSIKTGKPITAGICVGVAAGIKLVPAAWAIGLFLTRQWRAGTVALLTTGVLLAFPFAKSSNLKSYLSEQVLGRASQSANSPALDDQSLFAFTHRFVRPQSHQVPGLDPDKFQPVAWNPIVILRSKYHVALCGGALIVLGAWSCWRLGHVSLSTTAEGGFYAWCVLLLIAIPHTARYNHALLLPAMFFLWGRGRKPQKIVILIYLLIGLARLNHLWALTMPPFLVPLALGFGLAGAVLTFVGTTGCLAQCNVAPEAKHGGELEEHHA